MTGFAKNAGEAAGSPVRGSFMRLPIRMKIGVRIRMKISNKNPKNPSIGSGNTRSAIAHVPVFVFELVFERQIYSCNMSR